MEPKFTREVVIRALTGSHNYNMNRPESDEDFKYFVMPTFEDLYHGSFYSGGNQSETLDYTVHDIRKLGEQLWKSNINFLEVLFSTNVQFDTGLNFLFGMRNEFVAMNLPTFYNATYGMHLQKISGMFKGTATTQHLVDEFGYDTKAASHALRCLFTLQRYAETQDFKHAIYYRRHELQWTILMGIKNNQYSLEDFNSEIKYWIQVEKERVSEFYRGTKPNAELKEYLETQIMEYVKAKLLEH